MKHALPFAVLAYASLLHYAAAWSNVEHKLLGDATVLPTPVVDILPLPERHGVEFAYPDTESNLTVGDLVCLSGDFLAATTPISSGADAPAMLSTAADSFLLLFPHAGGHRGGDSNDEVAEDPSSEAVSAGAGEGSAADASRRRFAAALSKALGSAGTSLTSAASRVTSQAGDGSGISLYALAVIRGSVVKQAEAAYEAEAASADGHVSADEVKAIGLRYPIASILGFIHPSVVYATVTNNDHFHNIIGPPAASSSTPSLPTLGPAIDAYAAGHRLAAAIARAAGAATPDDASGPLPLRGNRRLLRLAVAVESFAQHFLTDIFASGHMSTPRRELDALNEIVNEVSVGDALAKVAHDEANAVGLTVRAAAAQGATDPSWRAYGDKHFLTRGNKENRRRAVEAADVSLEEIVQQYLAAQAMLPTATDASVPYAAVGKVPVPVAGSVNHFPLFRVDPQNGGILRREDVDNIFDSRTRSLCSSSWKCAAWWIRCWCGPSTYALLTTRYSVPAGNSHIEDDVGARRGLDAAVAVEAAANNHRQGSAFVDVVPERVLDNGPISDEEAMYVLWHGGDQFPVRERPADGDPLCARRRDWGGVGRVAAFLAGASVAMLGVVVGLVGAGYLAARVRRHRSRESAALLPSGLPSGSVAWGTGSEGFPVLVPVGAGKSVRLVDSDEEPELVRSSRHAF
eukprot:TRINITY_DN32968_c0_g1_i1.p1 TRINITY_DN32968_c0_g1~~TRINITY_DN32968_c0_g1_i1.p1  ORF type:complete len:687 (-),score=153.03 TRINITY_DN32968_c0_g1_i1:130-2190(-)